MVGVRPGAGHVARVTKAIFAGVLMGSALTLAATLTPQAGASSATPQWFTTGGTSVSSLACGTWYVTTLSAETGGGSATITLTGGGGGGGGSSTGLLDNANTATGGAGGQVLGTFTVAAGESIAARIGCGGGGGGAHSSGTTATGGTGGAGYSIGGNGGQQTTTANQSGGGAGGGSSAVCVYGTSGSPCATLLAIAAGGGGGGGAGGCTDNGGDGGNGGNGNAGASTGASATSESNTSAPGGSASGQGFGGGGGGADSDKQAAGGGGGGGVGAPTGTSGTSATTGSGGAANSTGGAGGAELTGGSGPAGSQGTGPNASGSGAAGGSDTNSDTQHQGGGGGGGGYYGGGSGAANACSVLAAVGAGAGGAGSSWVSTSSLTSFTNTSNPAFTAGTAVSSTSCGEQETQGTSGATSGAGGSGATNTTDDTISGGYAGCPGTVSLTWSALPGAPSGVTATGSSGQITVSWTAPDPGTGSLTSYKITADPVGGGSPVSETFNSTATTETVTGLSNGDDYDVSVAAISTLGTGPSANASDNPISLGVAPAITSPNNTTFTTGSAGSFTVATTGSPAPSITESGALPSGVSFKDNGNGTGTLSGTPAAGTGGTYPLTFSASNGISPNASQSFTFTVDQAPSITSSDSATFDENDPGSTTITTGGYPTTAISESRRAAEWRQLQRQRQRHGHPGRHAGRDHEGLVPDHDHSEQRGEPGGDAVVHPDGRCGAGDHVAFEQDVHRKHLRDVHRDLHWCADGGAHGDGRPAERGYLCRQP